jgi:hypothetical protein
MANTCWGPKRHFSPFETRKRDEKEIKGGFISCNWYIATTQKKQKIQK